MSEHKVVFDIHTRPFCPQTTKLTFGDLGGEEPDGRSVRDPPAPVEDGPVVHPIRGLLPVRSVPWRTVTIDESVFVFCANLIVVSYAADDRELLA